MHAEPSLRQGRGSSAPSAHKSMSPCFGEARWTIVNWSCGERPIGIGFFFACLDDELPAGPSRSESDEPAKSPDRGLTRLWRAVGRSPPLARTMLGDPVWNCRYRQGSPYLVRDQSRPVALALV